VYYIFRHGETIVSRFKLVYGPFEKITPILPTGIPAIKRMATYLKDIPTDANFSSPYLRCRQTVNIVEKLTGKNFLLDKRLGEYHKETISQMEQRLKSFLDEVKLKNYQNILICSHGWPIACLVDLITKGQLIKKDLVKYPPPGVLIIIDGNSVHEINFNKN
jgi:broad specificity phosphatase PhoE